MNRMIIIRGVSGTGKSTLAHIISSNVFETDDFFVDSGGNYNFDPKLLSSYHRLNQIRVNQALLAGEETIVVSNTFTQVWEMEPYIEMAKDRGYVVMVIALVGLHPNVHDVPPTVVETQTKRWEPYQGEYIYESAGQTPKEWKAFEVTHQVE